MTNWTRRVVLQRAMQLSALGVATPLAINLAAIGEAAAFDASGYKALVCIFLYGGNDHANTLIPYDPANYALYHQIRAGEAASRSQELRSRARISPPPHSRRSMGRCSPTDLQYALAPQLAGLKSLFDAGRLAIQLNVGPLIQPTTLAQYESSNRAANPLPPKLFSHNDQQSVWQSDGSEGTTNRLGRAARRHRAVEQSVEFPAHLHFREQQCGIRRGSGCLAVPDQHQWRDPHQRVDRPAAQRGERHRHAQQRTCAGKRMRRRHAALDRARGQGQRRARPRDADDTLSGGQSAREAAAGGGAADRRQREARRETPGVLRVARRLRQSPLAHGGASAAHDAARWRHERVSCRHGRTRRRAQCHDVHRVGLRSHPGVELRWLGSRLGLASFRAWAAR